MTVAAVIFLAESGRPLHSVTSCFGGSQASAPPPVIRASGEPSKIAPPPAQPDQSVNKFSYDRFGTCGSGAGAVLRGFGYRVVVTWLPAVPRSSAGIALISSGTQSPPCSTSLAWYMSCSSAWSEARTVVSPLGPSKV